MNQTTAAKNAIQEEHDGLMLIIKRQREEIARLNSLVSEPVNKDGKTIKELVGDNYENYELVDGEVRSKVEPKGRYINRIVAYPSENEIAKRLFSEYCEYMDLRNIKHPMDVGVAFIDWLDKKPYDPHEVAQMKEEMQMTNNGEGQ